MLQKLITRLQYAPTWQVVVAFTTGFVALLLVIDPTVDLLLFGYVTWHPLSFTVAVLIATVLFYFGTRILKSLREEGEKLKQSEERFRSVVDNIGIGVSLISPNMEILSMNKQMREWFPAIDLSQKPICFKSFNAPPRETTCVYCPTTLTMRDGQVHESVTETPAGDQIVNYLVRSSPIKDEKGNILAAIELVEDITAKKRVEDLLRDSEEKYRGLFNSTLNAVMVFDAETLRFEDVNRAADEIYGFTNEEFLARTPMDITAEPEKAGEAIKGFLEGKPVRVVDEKHRKKDGTVFPVQIYPGLFTHHGRRKIIGVIVDMTEQKRREGELQRRQDLLDMAQHMAGIGSWEQDMETGALRWSDELYRISGYEPGEIPSTLEDFFRLVHPEDVAAVRQAIRQMTESLAPFDREFRILRKDGAARIIHAQAEMQTRDGKPTVMRGIAQDITGRRAEEEALRDSEEKYRGLFNNTLNAVMVFDSETRRFEDVNPAATNMYGYTKEEFLTLTAMDITAEPEKTDTALKSFANGEPTYIVHRHHRRKDGTVFPVEIFPGTFMYRGRQKTVGVVVDLTEQKKREDDLRQLNDDLDQALHELERAQSLVLRSEKLASIGTLSAGVAHEILNPLNIMGTIVQLLLMDDLTPEHKKQLEEVLRQVRRATKITDNLRTFAHQHKDEITLVNVHDLFDRTAALMEHDLNLDNIVVERRYAKDFPPIWADEDKLAQVFLNLLTNARDALRARNGGVIMVSTARAGDEAEIVVADDGPGIPQEITNKIFDPFFTTKDPGQGTGLGLSLVYSIIESHDGRVWVDSEPGKGASFTIRLPVEHPPTSELAEVSELHHPSPM